ncbi:MAG: hypothetical protein AAGA96_19145, partial [Verrucomicrobiota bacterium]
RGATMTEKLRPDHRYSAIIYGRSNSDRVDDAIKPLLNSPLWEADYSVMVAPLFLRGLKHSGVS